MSLGFFDLPEDGLDPVEASARVARSITAAMDDLKDRGIVDYLSAAGSDEEFDARLATKGCFEVVATVAEKHLKNFEYPTETLVQHLKSAQVSGDDFPLLAPKGDFPDWTKMKKKRENESNPEKLYPMTPHTEEEDERIPWGIDPKTKKPWTGEDINKPNSPTKPWDGLPKSHPDCEVCNPKKTLPKKHNNDWEPFYNPDDDSKKAKVAFNPSEDTYLLEPKCQVAGCDKNADQGGVCEEHSVKKNVASVRLGHDDVEEYLRRNGYSSVEDWARDSDFKRDSDGTWRNEDGHPTDIHEYLATLVAEGIAE